SRAPLVSHQSPPHGHGVVSLSTGTDATCRTTGDQPGITLREWPRTTTVTVVAVRFAVVVAPVSTLLPPASARNAFAACTPSDSLPLSLPAARAPSCAAAIATVRAW